jgi:hypothetical protein
MLTVRSLSPFTHFSTDSMVNRPGADGGVQEEVGEVEISF